MSDRYSLITKNAQGEATLNFHAGQMRAWNSKKRIILVLAGSQGGKTSFGPFWLLREIAMKGPGDYIVAAPTFKLMSMKLLPEFTRLFKEDMSYGKLTGSGSFANRFLFNDFACRSMWGHVPKQPTQIFFGHAQDPDSLESATAKGIWLDEAGQKKFRLGSWEAVNRRGLIHQARILISTTPYALNWLKFLIYDPWKQAKQQGLEHPRIDVVQFKSIENPTFPREEYDNAKATMPTWKHRMFYDGEFERPAGAIYDCFDTDTHVVKPFLLPDEWPRFVGLDFGGVHTAGVYLAEELRDTGLVDDSNQPIYGEKTGRYYVYREYPERARWVSKSSKNHVQEILKGEVMRPTAVGGAGSEDQWREEFRVGGLPVKEPPIKEVEVGIDRVYETIKQGQLLIFDTCIGTIDDMQNYSREVDESGEPTEKIEDKNEYHLVDAVRYIIAYLKGPKKKLKIW